MVGFGTTRPGSRRNARCPPVASRAPIRRSERYGGMRLLPGVLSFAVAAAALAALAPRADAAFSDKLCPEATQYVIALTSVPPNDAQKVYDAAHQTTNAYEICSRRHLADANIEPGVHYAYTREASFLVVEARALLALNRPADAKAVLEHSRRLASDVMDGAARRPRQTRPTRTTPSRSTTSRPRRSSTRRTRCWRS